MPPEDIDLALWAKEELMRLRDELARLEADPTVAKSEVDDHRKLIASLERLAKKHIN
jgi:hypothetical protein